MPITVENQHQLLLELRRVPDLKAVPLSSQDVTVHLGDLAEEAFVRGVLEEKLPPECEQLEVRFEPVFSQAPLVERIDVCLTARKKGSDPLLQGVSPLFSPYTRPFSAGRWVRTAERRRLELRAEGSLEADETPYRMLVALPRASGPPLQLPPLAAPEIRDGTLEQYGVRSLGAGELVPDRPILANDRVVEDSVAACLAAGARETGRVVLGVHVRLPEALPGTSTRIVTLLTACIEDQRHVGQVNEWKISPEALADAAQIAELRGMGERVLTVVHTHGWSNECGNCNHNVHCPLAECTQVSLRDYDVLEKLFPSKATLMPIAGRKLGVQERRPVLEIHAWRGGEVRPVRWQRYHD